MGLEDYLLTAVLRGVLAQRLVRRLCDACKREAGAPPELVTRFGLERAAGQADPVLWHPVGCAQCRSTGYRGRQAIAEFLQPNAEIEQLIFSKADQRGDRARGGGGGHGDDVRRGAGRGAGGHDDDRGSGASIRAEA